MNESNNDCVGAELASLCTQRRLCLCSTAVYETMFLISLNLLQLTNHSASWDFSHPDRAETARQHLQLCFCFQSEAFFFLWLFSLVYVPLRLSGWSVLELNRVRKCVRGGGHGLLLFWVQCGDIISPEALCRENRIVHWKKGSE